MPSHTLKLIFSQGEGEEELSSIFSIKIRALFLLFVLSVET